MLGFRFFISIVLSVFSFVYFQDFSYAMEKVCFSPGDCCKKNALYLINNASSEIQIAMDHISSIDIFDALLKAKKRGIKILIITDSVAVKDRKSVIDELQIANILVRFPMINSESSRFAVFDRQIVMTGTYSWAEEDDFICSSDCIILQNDKITDRYTERFKFLWDTYR